MPPTFTSACRAALPVAALLAAFSTHASYMVIDDDLYPTSYMAESRARAMEAVNSENFKISFSKGSSTLSPMALSYLDVLVPRMRNAPQIRIIGRMDGAIATKNKSQRQVGTARASAIRAYLISQGISADTMEVEVETVGNPDAASGFSSSEIVVVHPRTFRTASEDRAIPRQYRHLPQPEPQAPLPVPVAATSPQPIQSMHAANDGAMLQYINQAVQAGQMAPSVAAQIIRSMIASNSSATVAAPVAAPTQTAAVMRAIYVPQEPAPARVESWTLDAGKNLKENFDAWAAASGWKPTVWEASNFYQVTSSVVLDGAFPDILKRIADSTQLNICAYPRDKYVRVTDPNVSCRNSN